MRSLFLSALAALTLACSGGGGSTPTTSTTHTTPPPPPPPVTTAPLPRATYTARIAPTLAASPVGTIPQTFIVAADGGFRGELGNFEHLRGSLYVDQAGAVSLNGDCTVTHPDGTTGPLTLSGTLANGRLTGTSNAGDFDLAVTTLQDQAIDLAARAGWYRSTASSNGMVSVILIKDTGAISGAAYATDADATAGKAPLGVYTGTISYTDPTKNCFNIGFSFLPDGVIGQLPATYGLCYFADDGGIVALTANHLNPLGGQWSAVFAKQ